MPNKIPIIDKIKKEIPAEWLATEGVSSFVEHCWTSQLCNVCSVSGLTVQAYLLCETDIMHSLPFCYDCVPDGSIPQGEIISVTPNYTCPHNQCEETFLLDEFFNHLDSLCFNMGFLDKEIERLQNLKFADSKLKDTSKALAETNNKLEENSVEMNRLEEQRKDLTQNKKDLENKVKKYQADVTEIRKLQARRKNPEEIDAFTCAICLEKYDNINHQQSCIISCFHSFCYSCLTVLEPKTCPKCRKIFTADQIKKIF